jgi:uncharacterized protein YegL
MKPNAHYTEIAFILDRSGSMNSCQQTAIAGFNQFLNDQQKTEGLAKLTLVLFDDEYLVAVSSIPVQEVVPLNDDTYQPRGCTALLDAIGKTVDDLGLRLAALAEKDRPGQVIVAILTDGLENASQRFNWKEIAGKIKHQTDTYKWIFLFLGANQDAIATAANLSIAAKNAATYVADDAGSKASQAAFSRKMTALRRSSMDIASVSEKLDAAASLTDIVSEESRKSREPESPKS